MATMKKKVKRKQSDTKEITIRIPDETYIYIREVAKSEIRRTQDQARYFLEIGINYLESLNQQDDEQAEAPEREAAIGFRVDKEDECDEEEDRVIKIIKRWPKWKRKIAGYD